MSVRNKVVDGVTTRMVVRAGSMSGQLTIRGNLKVASICQLYNWWLAQVVSGHATIQFDVDCLDCIRVR